MRWRFSDLFAFGGMVAMEPPRPRAQFEVTVPPEMLEFMTSSQNSIAPRISRREALQVAPVLRARNIIAGTLASLPIHYYDKDRNRARPTPLMDQLDDDLANVVVMADTYEDLLFEGQSWWRITAFNFAGFPMRVEHVEFSHVAITPAGEIYIDGKRVRNSDVIRFDSPNPPLLVHAARPIRACLRLDRTAAMYAEEPLPLGYFSPKPEAEEPGEAELQVLLDNWQAARTTRAWGYVAGGLDAKQLQWSASDIELTNQRKDAVIAIANATGLDPEDLGVSTTSRTYQNAEQRRLDLLDFTLMPYVKAVEERLSMRDVVPGPYTAKVVMDGFLRSDTKTRMEVYEIGKGVGAYTTDEIRELENRPALTAAEKAEIAPKPAPAPAAPTNGARPVPATNGASNGR